MKFHEGQELRSKQTGWRYEYIKPVDDNMAWCKFLSNYDGLDKRYPDIEADNKEHIGTISIDRLEPVTRNFQTEAYRKPKHKERRSK